MTTPQSLLAGALAATLFIAVGIGCKLTPAQDAALVTDFDTGCTDLIDFGAAAGASAAASSAGPLAAGAAALLEQLGALACKDGAAELAALLEAESTSVLADGGPHGSAGTWKLAATGTKKLRRSSTTGKPIGYAGTVRVVPR